MVVPANYMNYAASQESGGDPNAQNPLSSSSGLYGFLDSTRQDVARRHGISPTDDNALMQAFTADNAAHLQNAGYAPTNTNLYLAHHFGPAGAVKALGSDPNALVSDVFPEVIRQNPDLRGKTIGSLTGAATQPTGQGALSMAGPQQQPNQGALSGQQVAGGPGALFGNATPVGAVSDFMRNTLGIGQGDDMGRHLANAGAALQSISNPAGGAALMNANNMPLFRTNFSTFTTPDGYMGIMNHKTGQTTILNGAGGAAGAGDGTPGIAPAAKLAGQKSLIEDSQKEFAASQSAAQAAQQNLDLVKQARQLVNDPNVSQGAAGELRTTGKTYLKALGLDLGGVEGGHSLDEIAGQLRANQAKSIGITRYAGPEISMMKGMNVDLDRPQAVNAQALDNAEALAKRTIAQHAARTAYMKAHGVLGAGFQSSLDAASTSNPTYPSNPGVVPQSADGRPPLSSFFK